MALSCCKAGSPLTASIRRIPAATPDRKSTRLNSSHVRISYAVFCLKKKRDLEAPVAPGHPTDSDHSRRLPQRRFQLIELRFGHFRLQEHISGTCSDLALVSALYVNQ